MRIKPPFQLLRWRRMASGRWFTSLCNSHRLIAEISNGRMWDVQRKGKAIEYIGKK